MPNAERLCHQLLSLIGLWHLVKKCISVSLRPEKMTYRLAIVAKQHQACLCHNAGSAGPRDLQGLTISCRSIIQHTGAVESHFLEKARIKTAKYIIFIKITSCVLLKFNYFSPFFLATDVWRFWNQKFCLFWFK